MESEGFSLPKISPASTFSVSSTRTSLCLATDRVRSMADAVALVAAETEEAAQAAVDAICSRV